MYLNRIGVINLESNSKEESFFKLLQKSRFKNTNVKAYYISRLSLTSGLYYDLVSVINHNTGKIITLPVPIYLQCINLNNLYNQVIIDEINEKECCLNQEGYKSFFSYFKDIHEGDWLEIKNGFLRDKNIKYFYKNENNIPDNIKKLFLSNYCYTERLVESEYNDLKIKFGATYRFSDGTIKKEPFTWYGPDDVNDAFDEEGYFREHYQYDNEYVITFEKAIEELTTNYKEEFNVDYNLYR